MKRNDALAPDETIASQEPRAAPQAVTLRAIVIGTALAPLICYWIAYTQIRANSTDLVMMSLMAAAVFPLTTLIGFNALLKRLAPAGVLTRGELLVVYIMLASTVGLAGGGFVPFLASTIPAPVHFATPDNHWGNWFHYLKPWATLNDPEAVRTYYEGHSQFLTPSHLHAWLVPILAWSGFLLTLLFCGFCINTLFRRPWMDHERLVFPIAQIPLEMTRTDAPLWRNRIFWYGAAVPILVETINSCHFTFAPTMPFVHIKPDDALNLTQNLPNPPWNALGYFTLAFYPLAIGLIYLLPTEISFSCWFFYLIGKMELVLSTVYNFHGAGASLAASRMPYLAEQSTGAFLGLALLSIYAARRHLTLCFRKAFTGQGIDDHYEPLPYRGAVFGLLISGIALVVFAMGMGMAWHVAAIFFALYLLFMVTYTRIRAEAGLPWVMAPLYNPHGVMLDVGGFSHYNTQDLTGLARFEWFDMDYRSHMMPNQMDGMKIAHSTNISLRGLSLAIGLATITALIGSWLSCLHIFYTYGAMTASTNNWYATMGRTAFDLLQSRINSPTTPTDIPRIWALGFGAVVTLALSVLRTRFLWWPLHPIGYIVGNTFTMDWLWCPALIGWACKSVTMRYGGLKSYRFVLPFFIGLVVGDIVISSLWALLFLVLNIPGYRTYPI